MYTNHDDTSQIISPARKFRALDPNMTNSTLGLSQQRKVQKTTSTQKVHHVNSNPTLPVINDDRG